MSLTTYHRAQAQNPDREPYELAYHQRQARLLADPTGFYEPDRAADRDDIVRTLADSAEALDDDDLTLLSDSDLVDLLTKVDVALYQISGEMDRRVRRRAKK